MIQPGHSFAYSKRNVCLDPTKNMIKNIHSCILHNILKLENKPDNKKMDISNLFIH